MKQNPFLFFVIFAIIGINFISGCNTVDSMQGQTRINGTFYKNIGHPFSGPAIMSEHEYYRINGEKAKDILALPDGTKVNVIGTLSDHNRTIPQAGRFVMITEKTINATAFGTIG